MPKLAPKGRKPTSDEELAEHLRQAEDHLIGAINLFSRPRSPSREGGYLKRLERAQEGVTGLYREELVRIRGPQKPSKQKKRG